MSFLFSLHKNIRLNPLPENPQKQRALKAFTAACIKKQTNTSL